MSHQVVLVSTRSSDSSLELCLDERIHNDDDGNRIDCCDTTESSSSDGLSDHEATAQSPHRESKSKSKTKTKTKSIKTPIRRTLFPQSSWESTESVPLSKTKNQQEDESEQREEEASATPNTLFQDEMDIVAYQEWPPQRKQAYHQKLRMINGHFYRIRYPVEKSPSSVCASLSVETVATKLGRSPVVVSFDDDHLIHVDPSDLASPVSLEGRIQTGRFPRPSEAECKTQDNDVDCDATAPNKNQSPVEWCFQAIKNTLREMTCSK